MPHAAARPREPAPGARAASAATEPPREHRASRARRPPAVAPQPAPEAPAFGTGVFELVSKERTPGRTDDAGRRRRRA